ncbi:SsrA-binding protein SmpB [Neptunomonas antarctica]|uniref:SsrA-binding protein n=1 Tax=Neptunomonas antarctica TaxID=619304 RepID=A0A1N7J650_9GAMM|nr:SsrA-binding protein SmpB [Neptunomonas antarctica]SIS44721.1 SsrA-binding protein [Neptunomonas antarctica]
MAKQKKAKNTSSTICQNKRARYEYHVEEKFEAGVVFAGWEIKSLREGRAQLVDSYVVLKDGEAWLVGVNITPLLQASTHHVTEPRRDRKLLLHRRQIDKLSVETEAKGYTCVALSLYWKTGRVKCEIALVKGKQQHDKRQTEKNRDWDRQKQRIMATR